MSDDDMPDGLNREGQDLWRAAAGALRYSSESPLLGIIALHTRESLRMEATINALRTQLDVRDATIRMACDRLGGLVEGKPPHAGNFLQRIDELTAVVG